MKILVIQLRRIGDILLTTPAVSYLRMVFPQAQIDFLCEPMGRNILETRTDLHRILIYDPKKSLQMIRQVRNNKYDVAFDFFSNPRSRYLCFLSGIPSRVAFGSGWKRLFYNDLFPTPAEPEYVPKRKIRLIQNWLSKKNFRVPHVPSYRPTLTLDQSDHDWVQQWEKNEGLSGRSYAVVVPASRRTTRQWAWGKFKNLSIQIYKELGIPIYLAWGPGEKDLTDQIRSGNEDNIKMIPLCSLRQMAGIIARASLVVSNDSGPVHIAHAMGTPTLTIYGPTRPIDWNPSLAETSDHPKDRIITAEGLSCLGCHLNKCPIGHLCMENVSVDRVFHECRDILQGVN